MNTKQRIHRQTIPLNGDWAARLDPDQNGLAEKWYTHRIEPELTLCVPGCLQQSDVLQDFYPPAAGLANSYVGAFWIEKEVPLAVAAGERIQLCIGGAAPCGRFWVNGYYVGRTADGLNAINFDITEALRSQSTGAVRVTALITEEDAGLVSGFRFNSCNWSGLYREVLLIVTGEARLCGQRIDDQSDNGVVIVRGSALGFAGEAMVRVSVSDAQGRECCASEQCIQADDAGATYELSLDISALVPWHCEHPTLYHVTTSLWINGHALDTVTVRTGFRSLRAEGTHLLLNGRPLFLFGTGQEFFSPAISPLTDTALIRARFLQLQAHGFNFFRRHTYVPTEEELMVADELGILVSSEIGIVSNFHKALPYDKAFEALEAHIERTAHHPSLFAYCLGNEGSQLMVESCEERDRAERGYRLIKAQTGAQLAMIAFGMQRELPELVNDAETPHLWSDHFGWAYDGLARIPWQALDFSKWERPCIVHEYGKFGVFPSLWEQSAFPERGQRFDFGREAERALQRHGLSGMAEAYRKSSRLLARDCTRIILEEARAQAGVSGFTLWTFFRKGPGNAGLVDDMGLRPDGAPETFANGCNAPVALLIDRGFAGRALDAAQREQVTVKVSNFSSEAILGALLRWHVACGDEILASGELTSVDVPMGDVVDAGSIALPTRVDCTGKWTLWAELFSGETRLSANAWDFWAFTKAPPSAGICAYSFDNPALQSRLRAVRRDAVDLTDIDSAVRGCRAWKGTDYAETLRIKRPDVLVTDRLNSAARAAVSAGVPVLLLDGASLEGWYVPPLTSDMGPRDPLYMYAGFRAGWDHGNLATVIEPNPLLGDFPHEGYCGLQWFEMLQGAKPLDLKAVLSDFPGFDASPIVTGITKERGMKRDGVVVQDINAVKALKTQPPAELNLVHRSYLLALKKGSAQVCVASLRFFEDPAGAALLTGLINRLMEG